MIQNQAEETPYNDYGVTAEASKQWKYLQNYDKYMQTWGRIEHQIETARQKLNEKHNSKTAKVNKQQHEKGDISLQERQDYIFNDIKNKQLASIALSSCIDQELEWKSTLRKCDHDLEYDGIPELSRESGTQSKGEPAKKEDIKSFLSSFIVTNLQSTVSAEMYSNF